MFKFICFNILFLFSIVIKASTEEKKTTKFELDVVSTTCTFCNKSITTLVEQKCDCCAFALCCFSLVIPYIIVQNCRGKKVMPYNATHTCPYCGNTVGTYEPL